VEDHLRGGTLVELLAEHRPKEEDVWAVYPHRRHVPLKVKLAIEQMQHEFQSRPTMMALTSQPDVSAHADTRAVSIDRSMTRSPRGQRMNPKC